MKRKSTIAIFLLLFVLTSVFTSYAKATFFKEKAILNEDVVLLHGLARSKIAMWLLAARLEWAGYKVHRVGYESIESTPKEILKNISQQIKACCETGKNKLHFVEHSLGGLLIRAHLEENRHPNLGRVVLIGTPNQGTPIVDFFRDHWLMRFAGPTTLALGTDGNSFVKTLKDPYYPVGVIAGKMNSNSNMAEEIFKGDHDGLVPVESTKLNGMTDFIIIETGHSFMRYDEDVAEQTINFLKNGSFAK